MEGMTWMAQVSRQGAKPTVVAEYVLNRLGVFVKRERRVPKKEPLHKLTGFRVGYKAIPGTDYRAAPLDRNAILWQKVTSVDEAAPDSIRIRGNQKDEILLAVEPGIRDQVLQYVQAMRRSHPLNVAADFDAASWICWRDDDEWTDPYAPLSDMIAEELETERFLEPEVVEETVLPESYRSAPGLDSEEAAKPKFCVNCGAKLYPDSRFCEVCGEKVG